QPVVLVAIGIGGDDGLAPAVLRRGRRVGHDAHLVRVAPDFEKHLAAQRALGSALGVVDELERRAAALLPLVEPSALADVIAAAIVGAAAVPAQLLLRLGVRLAPELDACGLAIGVE